jgi:hypothetical protein
LKALYFQQVVMPFGPEPLTPDSLIVKVWQALSAVWPPAAVAVAT